jgi:hypothetical protein
VIVIVIVSAPVIVAALVNGNDTVAVIHAVSEDATADGTADRSSMLYFQKLDVSALDRIPHLRTSRT